MPLCRELVTILVAWLVVAVLPMLAVFGGAGWLAWRHERRWANVAAASLAALACVGSALLFRADPAALPITLGFVAPLLAHAWAAAQPSRPARAIAFAAAAAPPLGFLVYLLLELGATTGCHTV